jgi:hypothetical protein
MTLWKPSTSLKVPKLGFENKEKDVHTNPTPPFPHQNLDLLFPINSGPQDTSRIYNNALGKTFSK